MIIYNNTTILGPCENRAGRILDLNIFGAICHLVIFNVILSKNLSTMTQYYYG